MIEFPSQNDILNSMRNPPCYHADVLRAGSIIRTGTWVNRDSGGWACAFPFITADGRKIVVRCWFADIGDPKKRMLTIASHLERLHSSYFVKFDYHENALSVKGSLYPIVTMDWVSDPTLKQFLDSKISNNDKPIILKVAQNFKMMVRFFHENNIAHGDLSHGNIKIKPDGSLILLDYDSVFVQGLNGMEDKIKGLPGYQHPARHANLNIHSKLDYFSELVIYLSLLVFAEYPNLWRVYHETEDLLFSQQDYENPNNSRLINCLMTCQNVTIRELTKMLVASLGKNDITELSPLEELLEKTSAGIVESITAKF